MLQRETPGSQGDWVCQAKAASAALCGRRVTGGSPRPPRIRVREEHHPPFLPWVLPQAWIRGRCARSGSVRQSPGSGREAPRAPAPTPKPHTHKPSFPRREGLPPPRPGPLWIGLVSRVDLLPSSPAAVSDVCFCCSSIADLWQGWPRADGYFFFFFFNDWYQEACGWHLRARKSH